MHLSVVVIAAHDGGGMDYCLANAKEFYLIFYGLAKYGVSNSRKQGLSPIERFRTGALSQHTISNPWPSLLLYDEGDKDSIRFDIERRGVKKTSGAFKPFGTLHHGCTNVIRTRHSNS